MPDKSPFDTYMNHTPSASVIEQIKDVRKAYCQLLATLLSVVPDSREFSICKTNLEDSAMWAIKAMVLGDKDAKIDNLLSEAAK